MNSPSHFPTTVFYGAEPYYVYDRKEYDTLVAQKHGVYPRGYRPEDLPPPPAPEPIEFEQAGPEDVPPAPVKNGKKNAK